jgi:creatinine amidohydrolase
MVAVLLLLMAAGAAHAQGVFIEELTWPELRDRVAAGSTIALVPTGGTEQGGPHLALGKHSVVVREAARRIAVQLGNALVAPVIPVVPEGPLDKPSGNLAFPGTLGLSDDTYAAVLRDIARSLALSGFRLICFIGDHGQSQAVQARVADELNAGALPAGVRVLHVGSYYAPADEDRELAPAGLPTKALGDHAGVGDTAVTLAVRPGAVRMERRSPTAWPATEPSGASGRPDLATKAMGEKLLQGRVARAVREIRGQSR